MTLYYDADCGFCTRVANVLQRRWHRVEVPSLQSVELAALGIDAQRAQAEIPFRGSDGRIAYGSDAFAAAMIAEGRPWSWLGWLIAFPPLCWPARPTYRLIARHRHQLPGGTASCELPR